MRRHGRPVLDNRIPQDSLPLLCPYIASFVRLVSDATNRINTLRRPSSGVRTVTKAKDTQEFGRFQADVDAFTAFTKTLRSALRETVTGDSPDEATALLVRSVLVRLNDKTNLLVSKVHDNFVDWVHATSGEDVMPNLTRIHNPRGRKAGDKDEVDELD